MTWKYLSTPRLQRYSLWSLGMDKYFYLKLYNGCEYFIWDYNLSILVQRATVGTFVLTWRTYCASRRPQGRHSGWALRLCGTGVHFSFLRRGRMDEGWIFRCCIFGCFIKQSMVIFADQILLCQWCYHGCIEGKSVFTLAIAWCHKLTNHYLILSWQNIWQHMLTTWNVQIISIY